MSANGTPAKRIAPNAYDALVEAISVVYWVKADFERYLRSQLRERPELLAELQFDEPKRVTAQKLVTRLSQHEDQYQNVTIDLMRSIAQFDDAFAHLRRWEDADQKIASAREAVIEVRRWVEAHSEMAAKRDATMAEAQETQRSSQARRSLEMRLGELKDQYLSATQSTGEERERGLKFEEILNELFNLWDLQARGPFSLSNEQIDGAFTFDTDDYILEARWRKESTSRGDLDTFAAKIARKAANTRGLFISVSGFSPPALESHRERGTAMILMDGADLYSVFDGRITLTEVLERKRRHASETGDPYLQVRQMLN
jgi:hypothetical protein